MSMRTVVIGVVVVALIGFLVTKIDLGGLANGFASASSSGRVSSAACFDRYLKPGETLSQIARQYGTTVGRIASRSGIQNPDYVQAWTPLCWH